MLNKIFSDPGLRGRRGRANSRQKILTFKGRQCQVDFRYNGGLGPDQDGLPLGLDVDALLIVAKVHEVAIEEAAPEAKPSAGIQHCGKLCDSSFIFKMA